MISKRKIGKRVENEKNKSHTFDTWDTKPSFPPLSIKDSSPPI